MQTSIRKNLILIAVLVAIGTLAGCGTLSKHVAADGMSAQKLVWPKPSDVNDLHHDGTPPNIANLRQIHSGMNRKQVQALIGPPQFGEWFDPREWNYLFNFQKDDQTVQCGYKILFDEHKMARSFYWHPQSCAGFLKPPAPSAVASALPAPPSVEKFVLSADALFAFGKYKPNNMTASGVGDLAILADKLTAPGVKVETIQVIGYTDHLGSKAYNQRLSSERADTVRHFLIQKGVPADQITALGRGAADPVRTTCGHLPHARLITCLAPNRRVVVRVEARH